MFSKKVAIVRKFDFDPQDIAVAFYRVVAKQYGEDALCGAWKEGWWVRKRGNLSINNIKTG